MGMGIKGENHKKESQGIFRYPDTGSGASWNCPGWPVFADLADAQASVADYFDYYNHDRRHSSIGYLKSYQFHQQQLNDIIQFSSA